MTVGDQGICIRNVTQIQTPPFSTTTEAIVYPQKITKRFLVKLVSIQSVIMTANTNVCQLYDSNIRKYQLINLK